MRARIQVTPLHPGADNSEKSPTLSTKDGTLQEQHQLLSAMKGSGLSLVTHAVALVTHSLVSLPPARFLIHIPVFLSPSPPPPPLLSLPCPHPLSPANTKEIPDVCPCPGRRCPSHTQIGCPICLHCVHWPLTYFHLRCGRS